MTFNIIYTLEARGHIPPKWQIAYLFDLYKTAATIISLDPRPDIALSDGCDYLCTA